MIKINETKKRKNRNDYKVQGGEKKLKKRGQ